MPLVGEFHTKYWENSDTSVTPVAPARTPWQYPAWQSGIVLGSILGGAAPFFERFWDRLKWWFRAQPRVMALDPEARLVLLKTLDALEHEAYPLAQKAVRKTATTIAFNRPESWTELGRTMKRSAGASENIYRHMEACRLLQSNLLTSTLTNPQKNLMVELAYHGFAARGK
jgi:hypothetical protein